MQEAAEGGAGAREQEREQLALLQRKFAEAQAEVVALAGKNEGLEAQLQDKRQNRETSSLQSTSEASEAEDQIVSSPKYWMNEWFYLHFGSRADSWDQFGAFEPGLLLGFTFRVYF